MRNFVQLASGVDVQPLLLAVTRQRGLFNQHPFRTAPAQSPHREVDDLIVRAQPLREGWPDRRECVGYPAWTALPQVQSPVYAILARVQGLRLGRVVITALAPGKQIYPHADYGPREAGYQDHEAYWSRFHLVLQADAGSVFQCGEELVHMAPGELWWFDGGQQHAVWNDGQVERVHLLVDCHLDGDREDDAC